jgi:hypothetical protein
MADLIVRDRKDYPDADAARASLPSIYAGFPYVGCWLQPGDPVEYVMYVFTTREPASLAAEGWVLQEEGP